MYGYNCGMRLLVLSQSVSNLVLDTVVVLFIPEDFRVPMSLHWVL